MKISRISKRRLATLISAVLISSCAEDKPSPQKELEKAFSAMSEQLSTARASKNDAIISAKEAEADTFLHKTERRAENWTATVDSVRSGDVMQVDAENGSQVYHLQILHPDAKTLASKLKQSDRIEFTGTLGPERSITLAGGLSEPEFKFYPELIKVSGGAEEAKQPPDFIKQQLAQQEAADNENRFAAVSELRIVRACQKAIQKGLIAPDSADFPLSGAELKKNNSGKFLYTGHFSAKNGFGVQLKHDFSCLTEVKTAGKDISASVLSLTISP